MIDYKSIIDNLEPDKVEKLLYDLGAEQVIRKDNCLITNTICHNESGGSLKLYFYFDTHIFYCYSNCDSMSIFSFMKHYYETRDIEYDWYKDIYQPIISCSINPNSLRNNDPQRYQMKREDYYDRKSRKELPTYPKGVLQVFIKNYPPEWLNDGISKETMDKFDISYSISQNKIIIPHFDANNNLVGVRGRALNEWEIENLGKYMPVQIEQKWYSHPLSLNLYGLNFNKENILRTGICYIFEAEKSVMQLDSFNMLNCGVAVCGSQLNKYQVDILMRTCRPKEIVLCFDNEEKEHQDKYFQKLWGICKKYNHYCDFSFVYDRSHLTNLKDSPSDKGEKIFRQLLNKRVKVK